jgi:hypothetical protein
MGRGPASQPLPPGSNLPALIEAGLWVCGMWDLWVSHSGVSHFAAAQAHGSNVLTVTLPCPGRVLAGVWALSRRHLARSGGSAARAREQRATADAVLVSFLVGLSYFTYGSVSYRVFQLFLCEAFDDGATLLVSDYRCVVIKGGGGSLD